jgi:hypothetical protein
MDYKWGLGPMGQGKSDETQISRPFQLQRERITPEPEGELRSDQLELGKVYRIHYYGPINKLEETYLASLDKLGPIMLFTIVAYGTREKPLTERSTPETEFIPFNTNQTHNYYWRFFQTAQDRIVPQFEQQVLQSVFEKRLDKASAYGLTKDLLAPSKKSGGRKYKTRQTKLRMIRRKNRTRKNRRRTYRRR